MPDVDLRSIERLVTILLVWMHPKFAQAEGEKNALPLGKSRV